MAVVNVKVGNIRPRYQNLKEWMADPQNYYIGRRGIVFVDNVRFPPQDSYFHNPYKIGTHGTREQVLYLYEKYIRHNLGDEINGPNVKRALLSLKGLNLGCWCAPEPCHGHILLKLIDEFSR